MEKYVGRLIERRHLLGGDRQQRENLSGSSRAAAASIAGRSGPFPATTRCASGILLTASMPELDALCWDERADHQHDQAVGGKAEALRADRGPA